MSFKGLNSINIELIDSTDDKTKYTTSFELLIPDKKPKVIERKEEEEKVEPKYCKAKINRISNVGIMEITFSSIMNYTNITNLNTTSIEMYLEPANNWIDEYDFFDLTLLNFTWDVWRFENQSIYETVDNHGNYTNSSKDDMNETILWINLTFNSPPNISPTLV